MLGEGLVERPGGRFVAWAEWGDPAGRPLLRLHGTPGCRLNRRTDAGGVYERINAHVVTFDRPGYGRSSAHPDGTILTVADDALAVADAFGWDRFGVFAGSGGAPYALAIAVRAPARIAALGLVNPAVPAEMDDPDDMLAVNREGRRRALEEGRESFEEYGAELAAELMSDLDAAIEHILADAPAEDREMMLGQDTRAYTAESMREALVQGPQGWFDDSWLLFQPWGFELRDVAVPVRVWCSELDRASPPAAVRRMAAELDVLSLEVLSDAGHTGWRVDEERIFRTLLD